MILSDPHRPHSVYEREPRVEPLHLLPGGDSHEENFCEQTCGRILWNVGDTVQHSNNNNRTRFAARLMINMIGYGIKRTAATKY